MKNCFWKRRELRVFRVLKVQCRKNQYLIFVMCKKGSYINMEWPVGLGSLLAKAVGYKVFCGVVKRMLYIQGKPNKYIRDSFLANIYKSLEWYILF